MDIPGLLLNATDLRISRETHANTLTLEQAHHLGYHRRRIH
jgi:hypothetical protein